MGWLPAREGDFDQVQIVALAFDAAAAAAATSFWKHMSQHMLRASHADTNSQASFWHSWMPPYLQRHARLQTAVCQPVVICSIDQDVGRTQRTMSHTPFFTAAASILRQRKLVPA